MISDQRGSTNDANKVIPASVGTTGPAEGRDQPRTVRRVDRSRVGGIWTGLIAGAMVLVLLLIFVVQNSRTVPIHYLGASGHLSLAVALLLAAVFGLLLIAVPGSIRIVQLRRTVRRGRVRDETTETPPAARGGAPEPGSTVGPRADRPSYRGIPAAAGGRARAHRCSAGRSARPSSGRQIGAARV